MNQGFQHSTRFIVKENGKETIKSFADYHDGDEITIKDKDNNWVTAIVHKYDKKKVMYRVVLSNKKFMQAVYKTPRRIESKLITPKIGDSCIRTFSFSNTDDKKTKIVTFKKIDKSEEFQKIITNFLRQFVYSYNNYRQEYINTLLKICDEEYREKVQLNLEYFESMNEFGRMAPDDKGAENVLSTLQVDFINDRNDLDKNTKDKVLSYIENQSKKEFDDNLSFSSLISNTISDLLHEVC